MTKFVSIGIPVISRSSEPTSYARVQNERDRALDLIDRLTQVENVSVELIVVCHDENAFQMAKTVYGRRSEVEVEIKLLKPLKRSKIFTLPTRFIREAKGDRLIFLKSGSLAEGISTETALAMISSDSHINWIDLATYSDHRLDMITRQYNRGRKHSNKRLNGRTVGFSISRGAVYQLESLEDDVFDVFFALNSLAIEKKPNFRIHSQLAFTQWYSQKEANEIRLRFVSPYRPFLSNWSWVATFIVFATTWFGIYLLVSESVNESLSTVACSLGVVFSITIFLIWIYVKDLIALTKQSIGAGGNKDIAGEFTVEVL